VLNDASGSRLAVSSQVTGTVGALSVTNNTTSLTFEPPVGGTNATFTLNGIPYANSTNTVTGAIPDVTLNLISAAPGTQVDITVAPDITDIGNAINNFVTDYNKVIGDINTQFTVNTSTDREGPLGSDTDLRILQSSLANDVSYATTDSLSQSSGMSNLAAIGITMNNDGTLSVDSSTLDDALTSNPAAVENFFTNSNGTGFADNFSNDLNNLTNATTGVLNADLAANQNQQTDLNSDISNFQTQLQAQATALTQELDQVNATLEEYPILLQEVNAALGSLNASGSTSGSSGTLIGSNTAPTSGTPTYNNPTSGSSGTSGNSGTGS